MSRKVKVTDGPMYEPRKYEVTHQARKFEVPVGWSVREYDPEKGLVVEKDGETQIVSPAND